MKTLNSVSYYIFWELIVRIIVLIILGLNIRRRELLPTTGPAIIVANHNSHLDTIVLMSLYSLKARKNLHPVAAADYFLRNKLIRWFAFNIVGIVTLERTINKGIDPFEACYDILDNNGILIFYPEGSRGEPERIATFKAGIAHLAERYNMIPITPVFLHGLGQALPKGDALLVPFFCDMFVDKPFTWHGNKQEFMTTLAEKFKTLSSEKVFAPWE